MVGLGEDSAEAQVLQLTAFSERERNVLTLNDATFWLELLRKSGKSPSLTVLVRRSPYSSSPHLASHLLLSTHFILFYFILYFIPSKEFGKILKASELPKFWGVSPQISLLLSEVTGSLGQGNPPVLIPREHWSLPEGLCGLLPGRTHLQGAGQLHQAQCRVKPWDFVLCWDVAAAWRRDTKPMGQVGHPAWLSQHSSHVQPRCPSFGDHFEDVGTAGLHQLQVPHKQPAAKHGGSSAQLEHLRAVRPSTADLTVCLGRCIFQTRNTLGLKGLKLRQLSMLFSEVTEADLEVGRRKGLWHMWFPAKSPHLHSRTSPRARCPACTSSQTRLSPKTEVTLPLYSPSQGLSLTANKLFLMLNIMFSISICIHSSHKADKFWSGWCAQTATQRLWLCPRDLL